MKTIKLLLVLVVGLIGISCQHEVKPIYYNLDVCEYCHMVITDARYGTAALTTKGKTYKFDSFECLIDHNKEQAPSIQKYYITSFDQPKSLQEASNCWVIQCQDMRSPMGRFLTVFDSEEKAKAIQDEKGGEILPFDQALNEF